MPLDLRLDAEESAALTYALEGVANARGVVPRGISA